MGVGGRQAASRVQPVVPDAGPGAVLERREALADRGEGPAIRFAFQERQGDGAQVRSRDGQDPIGCQDMYEHAVEGDGGRFAGDLCSHGHHVVARSAVDMRESVAVADRAIAELPPPWRMEQARRQPEELRAFAKVHRPARAEQPRNHEGGVMSWVNRAGGGRGKDRDAARGRDRGDIVHHAGGHGTGCQG